MPTIIEAAELLYAAHDVEDIHSAFVVQTGYMGQSGISTVISGR